MWSQRSLSLPLPPTLFLSDIFTSCWHPPTLASASLSHDVLSIDCNKKRSTICILAPIRTDPCRYLLVKMCYLFVQTLLSNPLVMADLLSRCVWIWIICYDGWTCLVTPCPDICQSRLSVNRRCWERWDKTSTEAMQSHTNYHHNDTPQVVCLGFQRFISHMLEWRGNCSVTPSIHPVVVHLGPVKLTSFNAEIFVTVKTHVCAACGEAPLLSGKPLRSHLTQSMTSTKLRSNHVSQMMSWFDGGYEGMSSCG